MPSTPALTLLVAAVLVVTSVVGATAPTGSSPPAPADAVPATAARAHTADLQQADLGPPDGNITVLRGSGELVSRVDSIADLGRARDAGRLARSPHIVPGDTMVLQFRSPGLATRYAEVDGRNATDRFFRLLATTGANVTVESRDDGVDQLPAELALNRTNVRVLHDPATETFALLVDTGAVAVVERGDGDPLRRLLSSLEFRAVVEVPTDDVRRVLVGTSQFARPAATLESPDEGVHLEVVPATISRTESQDLTVTGRTTVLPGRNLTVRAVGPDGAVLAERRVTTAPRNASSDRFGPTEFRTELDLGGLELDDRFRLVVLAGDRRIADRRVLVGDPPGMWNVTAGLVEAGEHAGAAAVSATLLLPAPGFLVVDGAEAPVVVEVPADTRTRITLHVADPEVYDGDRVYVSAMWDADGDGRLDGEPDRLFRTTDDRGAAAGDDELDASVPIEGWSERTATQTATVPEGANTGSIPGFGPIAAVLSVVLVAALARRRAS